MDKRWREIEILCEKEKKIYAIKLYMELTGVGLRESKEAVEYYINHGVWSGHEIAEQQEGMASNDVQQLEILACDSARYIQAIKLFRGSTGFGLKDSKGAVDYFAKYGEWAPKVHQLLYGVSPVGLDQNISQVAIGAEKSDPQDVDLIGMNIGTVAQEGSPILEEASSLSNKGTTEVVGVLNEALGYTPRIVAEMSASKQLETGLLFLSNDAFFFCSQRMGQWVLEEKWALSDIMGHHFSTSFMGGELELVLQDGSVRFSNLVAEEGELFMNAFLALINTNEAQTNIETHSSEVLPEVTIQSDFPSLEIEETNKELSSKSSGFFKKVMSVLFLLVAILVGLRYFFL